MNPNIKCTCPFGNPTVSIAENCPIHGGLKNDYQLVPMSEITDEARMIAVAWMEEDDRSFIANKHKLASDIMNYARRHNEKLLIEHLKQLRTLAEQFDVVRQHYEKELAFRDQEIALLKNKPA